MSKFIIYSAEILVFLILLRFIFQYWNKRIFKAQNLLTSNKAYGFFTSAQIIALGIAVYYSTESGTIHFLENLEVFGNDALDYWMYFSIKALGIIAIYALSIFVSLFFYKLFIPAEEEFKDEILADNWAPVLPVLFIQLFTSLLLSFFILRPILLEIAIGFKKMGDVYY